MAVTPTAPKPRKKRPGRLWLFFWGRKRRGFPGLLVGTVVILVVLGLAFGIVPHGTQVLRYLFLLPVLALVLVLAAAIVLTVLAALGVLKPKDRRRRRRP
ncbi:MAG: hypothetical protein ACREOV_06975 [Candidatus Dormibacteraceae bacterium]